MKLPLYWIDAFTDRVFHGNPAAVIPLERWLDDAVLQRIAFENGLSETAYFVRTAGNQFRLRWFTPAVEVDLCGHATIASGHVLFNELGHSTDQVLFESRSGPLSVTRIVQMENWSWISRPELPLTSPRLNSWHADSVVRPCP